tara:strand:- start:121 stop:540 length:420 start_codon:yes stop_codon:yes gene_type:complete
MRLIHHPNDELIFDYASCALGEARSLPIATHLALCSECRREVHRVESIGGNLLDTASPLPISKNLFNGILARIESNKKATNCNPTLRVAVDKTALLLPSPIRQEPTHVETFKKPMKTLNTGFMWLLAMIAYASQLQMPL